MKSSSISMKLSKEDYLLSFWVRGVSVFVTDINREAYADLEVLYIIDHGLFKQYFTKKAFKKALNKGLRFYSDTHAFKYYKEKLTRECKVFRGFFNADVKNTSYISKKTLKIFFGCSVKLCKEYTMMNFEHTDKAFAFQNENKTIK